MGKVVRYGELEIDEDLSFQERTWRVERVAWVAMVLILLAALIGLLGPGPLSSTTAGQRGSALWMDYDRFVRFRAPNTLQIWVDLRAASGRPARIWLDRDYLKSVQVDYLMPVPQSVESAPDRLIYTFRLAGDRDAALIEIPIKVQAMGRLAGRVGLEGGPVLEFNQFSYP